MILRNGMGDLGTACGTITNALCNTGAVQSVMGVPCSACAEPAPITVPSVPTLPIGYDPATGTLDATANGQTGVTPFSVTYPSNPGGGSSAGDQFDAAGCDMTAQSWLDTSTWCQTRWIELALGGALALVLLVNFGGRR